MDIHQRPKRKHSSRVRRQAVAPPRQLSADALLREIEGVLTVRCPVIRKSWAELTSPLIDHVYDLGKQCGYSPWRNSQYLWDIAWTYEPPDAKRYWLELAGEIEVSDPVYESCCDDLYKVIDAKARLKLFITAPASCRHARKMREELEWVWEHQRFRLPEERLVAVTLEYDGRAGCYSAHGRTFGEGRNTWRVSTYREVQ